MRVELHLDPSACAQPQRGFVLNDRFDGTACLHSGPATDPNRDHNQEQPPRAHLSAAHTAPAAAPPIAAQSHRVGTNPSTRSATRAAHLLANRARSDRTQQACTRSAPPPAAAVMIAPTA